MSGYDIGQVWLNGHPTNGSTRHFPQGIKEYCPDCGAKTIIAALLATRPSKESTMRKVFLPQDSSITLRSFVRVVEIRFLGHNRGSRLLRN